MFHKSNLGRFVQHVERFADQQGYVPQAGDDWRDLQYGIDEDNTEEVTYGDDDWWPDFVEAAVAATERANRAIDEWRKEHNMPMNTYDQ